MYIAFPSLDENMLEEMDTPSIELPGGGCKDRPSPPLEEIVLELTVILEIMHAL
jgi:hypothetical protein